MSNTTKRRVEISFTTFTDGQPDQNITVAVTAKYRHEGGWHVTGPKGEPKNWFGDGETLTLAVLGYLTARVG